MWRMLSRNLKKLLRNQGWIMFIFHCLSKSLVITNGYFLIFFSVMG
ncbi:hypothetical protein HMPREF1548_05447 [Clostridium sp. KLE 1755]|nr:hypothetical protein HMPREF1548_05447 [Clostridium sp. KLE 1755]